MTLARHHAKTLTRPPQVPGIVTDPTFARPVDWTPWYLTEEEDMGQSPDQTEANVLFADVLKVRFEELERADVYVGMDNFFGWVEGEPLVQVSPDVYTLSPPPPRPLPRSFQTYRPGVAPPTLAVEIVSADWEKDYRDNPPKYAMLGVEELVVFDPAAAAGLTRGDTRVALQVWRRSADGNFLRAHFGDGPTYCEAAQGWLVVIPAQGSARLRLGRDESGHELVPTTAERAEAERKRAEAERERAEAERERAEAAEAELGRLRARLAALEG